MNLRLSLSWLCGLAFLAASGTCLMAQEDVKPAQSFPLGEPLAGNPKPTVTNLPVSGAHATNAKTPPAAPATTEQPTGGPKPPGSYVSSWLLDMVKLAQAGINQEVMLTFIDSAGTFNLDADQIIYLHDLRVPAEVITAMMQHDFEIASGLRAPGGAVSGSQPGFNVKFAEAEPPSAGAASSKSTTPSSLSTRMIPAAAPAQTQPSPLVWRGFEPQHQASQTPAMFSPVRLPYAVQLTDPIIMIPGEGRSPNLVVIELFP